MRDPAGGGVNNGRRRILESIAPDRQRAQEAGKPELEKLPESRILQAERSLQKQSKLLVANHLASEPLSGGHVCLRSLHRFVQLVKNTSLKSILPPPHTSLTMTV